MINKSILVLEENSVVHGLVASALDVDGLTLHHEFNPAKYVDRARTLKPDLILVSNADQYNNYSICRQLKTGAGDATPLVLLANSKDELDAARLRDLHVDGVVRKPFEAGDLQEQVSRHLRVPDLVGAGYEYRQTQSSRESVYDPLAQMEVLDDETVTMMKTTGAGSTLSVPEVDFSAELGEEVPPEDMMDSGMATALTSTTVTTTRTEQRTTHERTVERLVESSQSPLPLADFDDSDLAPFPDTAGDVLLAESNFEQEDLSEPFSGMRAGEEESFEELGAEDLLEEESLEEAGQLSLGAEAPELAEDLPPEPVRPSTLDQIDVELSAADLTLQGAALDAEPDDMTLFEKEFDSPATSRLVDETIPLAVRRMMELKPVFTPPVQTGAAGVAARTQTSESRTTTTITTTTSLATAGETRRPDTSVPEMPWPELAPEQALPEMEDDLEDLRDIDLGDDALDEEQILSAMESEPLAELDEMDGLEDDSLLSLSIEEEQQIASVPEAAVPDVELSAPDEDDEEISIDEDEEELILSSLEEEELQDMALDAAPTSLDLTHEERTGLDEIMSATAAEPVEELPAATLTDTDEQEIAAMDLDLSAQEATPRESAPPFPVDEMLEVPLAEEPAPEADLFESATVTTTTETFAAAHTTQTMESATDILLGGEAEPFLPEDLDAPPLDMEFGADDLEADLFSESDLATAGDALLSEVGSEPEPEPLEPPEPAEAAAADGGDSDFEDAFAALRSEIQSNPEGEHLDDVLRLEGIQNKVSRLDFTIPQHESPFARGMGIYAVDEGAAAIEPLAVADAAAVTARMSMQDSLSERRSSTTVTTARTTTIETRLSQALEGAPLTGSLLDEATKARLSQVLDEIISISVRKAVREEMPRLMQRLAKDPPRA